MRRIEPCRAEEFVARQISEIDDVTDRTLGVVREEIPFYRSLDDDAIAQTRAVVRATLSICLTCWRDGRMPDRADASGYPRVAVVEGTVMRPLSVVLRAWRVGTSAALAEVLDRGGNGLDAEDVAGLSLITHRWLDLVTEAILDAYAQAARARDVADEQLVGRDLAVQIVTGGYSSLEAIRRRAQLHGLDIPEPAAVVVTAVLDEERIDALRGAGSGATGAQPLEAILDRRLVIVAEPGETTRIGARITSAAASGAAVEVRRLGEGAAAYRTAVAALAFLAASGDPAPTFVTSAQARLAALLVTEIGNRSEIDGLLEAIGADEDTSETLLAYFETTNAESAAHRLGVHPQTVRSRLRRVRDRTGLDPTTGWSRFLVEVAIRLRAG